MLGFLLLPVSLEKGSCVRLRSLASNSARIISNFAFSEKPVNVKFFYGSGEECELVEDILI